MKRKHIKYVALRFISLFILIAVIVTSKGCTSRNEDFNKENKKINIALENSELQDLNYIKIILENFKDTHKDYDMNIESIDNLKDIKEDITNKKYDIVISQREAFLELNEYGLVKDLTSYFNQNNSNNKFYDIIFSYGKIGEKNLGMAFVPTSIEILYNKNGLGEIIKNKDTLDVIKEKIKSENFSIPYILPENMNINLVLSSIVFNNIIKENNLINIYNSDKEKYLDVVDISKMFQVLNVLANDYGLRGNKLLKSNKDILDELDKGTVQFVICTSDIGRDLKHNYTNIGSLSDLGVNNYKVSTPVFSNYIVYATSSSENAIAINKFFDYMVSNKTYEPLVKMNVITGNKRADSNFTGINKVFVDAISRARQNNIPYYLNLPQKFIKPLQEKINDILDKNVYASYYWREIVNSAFN